MKYTFPENKVSWQSNSIFHGRVLLGTDIQSLAVYHGVPQGVVSKGS